MIQPEDLGIDPELCKAIANRGCMALLDANMIVFNDGNVIGVADEFELCEEIEHAIEQGRGGDIAYIFSDSVQMDMDYRIEVDLSPVNDNDDKHFQRDGDMETAALDRECDKQMLMAMEGVDDAM